MFAYGLLIFMFFALGLFYRSWNNKEQTTRFMITIFFIGYLILLCLRDKTVGIDTVNYIIRYFNIFHYMRWKDIFSYKVDEVGFSILVKLIAVFTDSNQAFMIIMALLGVIPVMILYRRESKEAAVCCSFFMISLLFEIFFSGLRQGIALGLTVPAYYYCKQKKIVPFLLIVALAATFHVSAVMILFIYPIYHAKIIGKWLWVVVPIMGLIYYYNRLIFTTLFEVFGGKYFEKYSTLTGTTNQYGLLMLFILISAYCIIMMDADQADEDDIGFRNILLLATVIQFFAPLHNIVSRLNYYYILFIPIALSRANFKCKQNIRQITPIASAVMTVYFIFFFFFNKGDQLHIMEYILCF